MCSNRIDKLYNDIEHETFKTHKDVCICLIDIENYTNWCKTREPMDIYLTMTKYNKILTELLHKHAYAEKIELVGDCVLIVSGISDDNQEIETKTSSILSFCFELLQNIKTIKHIFNDDKISLRIGVHIGDICSGMIYHPKKYQVFGSDINLTSRLESTALSGTVHVSSSVCKRLSCEYLRENDIETGKILTKDLKGVGSIDTMLLFQTKTNEILIGDDILSTCKIIERVIEKNTNYKTTSATHIDTLLEMMYTCVYSCVILDRYYDVEDILPKIKKFREWETDNRNFKQPIFLISNEIPTEQIIPLVQDFIHKSENFYSSLLKKMINH